VPAETLPPEAKPTEAPAPEAQAVEPAPEAGKAAPTPEEKTVLENTSAKSGEDLNPTEVKTEKEIASRSESKPINDPPFTSETELPNGHKMKQNADGSICERCSPGCGVYNENGELVAQTEPGQPRRMGTVSAGPEGVVEHTISTPEVETAPPRRGPSAPPEASAAPEAPVTPTEEPVRAGSTSEDIAQVREEAEARTTTEEQQTDIEAEAHKVTKEPDPRTSESTTGPERARAEAEARERGPHPDDMRGNEAEIGSTVPEDIPEGDLFEPEVSEPLTPERAREAYMGSTPSKYSETGGAVVERMRSQGLIRGDGPLLPGNPNNLEVQATDGSWHLIDETIDMAHYPTDAVKYWNEEGRFYGARSPEVREFMTEPNNYRLEPRSSNRSAGAKLGEVYLPPEK